MESETIKVVISFLSALIAIISAVLANRARIQTRNDIFNNQRDTLILAMTENDNRCHYIKIRCAYIIDDLEKIDARNLDSSDRSEIDDYLTHMRNFEQTTSFFDQRIYDEEALDKLTYSEKNLSEIRKMARLEQIGSKRLSATVFDFVFDQATIFLGRLKNNASSH